ncbi:hypothetical protein KPB2_5353 [Klebsiella pneumoniae Kb677]|nr:hypothetical protein KPB2_5353 [Klebsiella pneumoniae Kb677]
MDCVALVQPSTRGNRPGRAMRGVSGGRRESVVLPPSVCAAYLDSAVVVVTRSRRTRATRRTVDVLV